MTKSTPLRRSKRLKHGSSSVRRESSPIIPKLETIYEPRLHLPTLTKQERLDTFPPPPQHHHHHQTHCYYHQPYYYYPHHQYYHNMYSHHSFHVNPVDSMSETLLQQHSALRLQNIQLGTAVMQAQRNEQLLKNEIWCLKARNARLWTIVALKELEERL
ncbi:hypothetical protein BDR26DRAFT_852546 [Obelidium mucronatum]|nr:hypothetical protein BDR26DRAFT_852546 [Obelidium mucronatum]